ncbi:MAG: pyridoxamine 5'-phosphate oxidase family protein [Actinobacteria bacterium]|nr:MAG: pyridoxamine 5'-phosphate oxidase family protein [Actinomycetota bacterium]
MARDRGPLGIGFGIGLNFGVGLGFGLIGGSQGHWSLAPALQIGQYASAADEMMTMGEMKPGRSVGILTEDMQRVIEAELGFIATVCPDGTPNLSPKGTTAVWDDDHLVFADLRSPGTVENLRSNASIEINVVDQLIRKGYRFKGTGAVYTEGDVFERGVQFYEARGTIKARERIRGIVIVAVERALPVTSPAYDIGLTEDALRESNLRRG